MRRSRIWLIAAALLLASAALLMFCGTNEKPEPEPVTVEMPRRMDRSSEQRLRKRQTVPPVQPLVVPRPQVPPRPRDPVIAAIPPHVKHVAVVVEANALVNSPIGPLMIDCLRAQSKRDTFEEIKKITGVDPLKDLDRVAMIDETVVLTGQFGSARWNELFQGAQEQDWGEHGRVYDILNGDGGVRLVAGTWNDQMLIFGESPDDVTSALDRIEGHAPEEGPPALGDQDTYGDIYGVLSPDSLTELFPTDQGALAQRFAAVASRIKIHADASHDVGMVADVDGTDATGTADLGRSLGAALAVARLKAQADGEDALGEILDLARVEPGASHFRVELGLPLPLLEKHFKKCVEEGGARQLDAGEPLQADGPPN